MEPDQLLGVEVRHLAALAAIARTRSFSRAGAELGYAQSAISQQLAALERAVGHRLVERPGGPKAVSLTEAGELLLRHAEFITARLSAAKADLDALSAGAIGTLRVGTFQSAEARLIPPTLGRFRERFPDVEVRLHPESTGAALDRRVSAGSLDLAFTDLYGAHNGLEALELLIDPFMVLLPPGSPLSQKASVELADLDGLAMISNTLATPCLLRLDRAFTDARVEPNVVFTSDDNLTVQRLVSSGLGCAVMPALAIEDELPGMNTLVRPLAPASRIERHIGIVWHADRFRSAAALAFVDAARQSAALEQARPRSWQRSKGSARRKVVGAKALAVRY